MELRTFAAKLTLNKLTFEHFFCDFVETEKQNRHTFSLFRFMGANNNASLEIDNVRKA